MLPGARQIGKFEIHEFHLVVLDHFADVSWVFFFGHGSLCSELGVRSWELGKKKLKN
jgi:hypothetical protein